MSDDPFDMIHQLYDEAEYLPYGELRVKLLDEAVKYADLSRDPEAMFHTRMNLIQAATFSGFPEKSTTAFAWCLAQFQADSETYADEQHSLLWFFKNIHHSMQEFPQVPRDHVEKLRDQMADLYQRSGYNQRPVHYTRFSFCVKIGDREQATESYHKFHACPRDSMADCIACEADTQANYFELMGDYERALHSARDILAGRQTCAEVPHRTYCNVLRPLAMLERYEEADNYQRSGYRLVRDNPAFMVEVAQQMAYLLHRDRLGDATKMLERHLDWTVETHELYSKLHFYLAARSVLRAQEAESSGTITLRLPEALEIHEASGEYDLPKLIGWFDNEVNAAATRFDARHGNEFCTAELPTWYGY